MSRPRHTLGNIPGLRKARDILKPSGPPEWLDADGNPAHLSPQGFGSAVCLGWVDDPVLDALPDAEDLVTAIGYNPGKLAAGDNTVAKVRTKLAAEIAKAKTDREAGITPGKKPRPKPPAVPNGPARTPR